MLKEGFWLIYPSMYNSWDYRRVWTENTAKQTQNITCVTLISLDLKITIPSLWYIIKVALVVAMTKRDFQFEGFQMTWTWLLRPNKATPTPSCGWLSQLLRVFCSILSSRKGRAGEKDQQLGALPALLEGPGLTSSRAHDFQPTPAYDSRSDALL